MPTTENKENGVNPDSLRVHSTIGQSPGLLEFVVAACVHLAVWGGGMILGPVSLVLAPLSFLFVGAEYAAAFSVLVGTLIFMPALPESPFFCRLYLKSAALLKGGSTLWVAEQVIPHLSADGVMVCYHPHGVVPLGFSLNGAVRAKTRDPVKYLHEEAKISHHVSGVQAPVLFKIPILRQVLQLFGCTMPATKEGMQILFEKKMTFGIVVGGSEDVAIHMRGRERTFLKHRAGFLKYALQHGFKALIAYNFGESDLYDNAFFLRQFNMWLVKRFGFVLPIFRGRWWCPLLPRSDAELNTVFGEVLQLPCIKDPTPEDVAEWHEKYIDALTHVFDTHKGKFGFADRQLEVL